MGTKISSLALAALQKKEGAGKPTPSVIDPEFQASMRYFAKQAESSISPGQSTGTNVVQ